jgi:hypothetical protein
MVEKCRQWRSNERWVALLAKENRMLFNNSRKRNHVKLYGNDAFFDLETSGPQAKVADRLATELTVGETCVVATPDIQYDTASDVTFDTYRFSRGAVKRDRERNVPCHAYFGKLSKTETMSRREAMKHPVYSQFFNINGHFKRPSVMRLR